MYVDVNISGPYHIVVFALVVMSVAAVLIDLADRRHDLVFLASAATIAVTFVSWLYS